MSRRISTTKRFPTSRLLKNNLLEILIINKILKNGKKILATRILEKAFDIIYKQKKVEPLLILEKAIRNVSPKVQLKSKRIGGSTYQVPSVLTRFKSINLSIRWLLDSAKKRNEKSFFEKLAFELLEASQNIGASIKKKEETHKMALANKAFIKL